VFRVTRGERRVGEERGGGGEERTKEIGRSESEETD